MPGVWFFFIVTKSNQAHLEVLVFKILQAQYLKTEAVENLIYLKTSAK